MNAVTLISRRTPSSRCEDFGRDVVTPPKPVAQPTPNSIKYSEYEKRMMEEAAKMKKRKQAEAEALTGSNEERKQQYWQPILDVMNGPMTSQQIAPLVGRQVSPVANSLKAMEKAGLVSRKDQGRDKNGRQLPMIWSRVKRACHIANRTKGEKTRTEIYNLVSGTVTAAEVAVQTKYQPHHVQQVLRELERRGMVKRAGKGPKVNGKGSAPTLWVRA